MERPTSPAEHQSRAKRNGDTSSTNGETSGTFITTTSRVDQMAQDKKRNSILKLAGDIEFHKNITKLNETEMIRTLENNAHMEQQKLKQAQLDKSRPAFHRKKSRARRGSMNRTRRGSVKEGYVGITKKVVEKWNHQFDRDEPPPNIIRALRATGHISLKELSEVGGDDLLGYPTGNDPGDTRSFMLLLS